MVFLSRRRDQRCLHIQKSDPESGKCLPWKRYLFVVYVGSFPFCAGQRRRAVPTDPSMVWRMRIREREETALRSALHTYIHTYIFIRISHILAAEGVVRSGYGRSVRSRLWVSSLLSTCFPGPSIQGWYCTAFPNVALAGSF